MLSKSDIKKTLANCCEGLFVLIKKVRIFFRTYRQLIKICYDAVTAKAWYRFSKKRRFYQQKLLLQDNYLLLYYPMYFVLKPIGFCPLLRYDRGTIGYYH